MTISKEYLLNQLESAVESRLDALKTFHMRDGAVQMIQLLLNKLDEPAIPFVTDVQEDDLMYKPPKKKFPKLPKKP